MLFHESRSGAPVAALGSDPPAPSNKQPLDCTFIPPSQGLAGLPSGVTWPTVLAPPPVAIRGVSPSKRVACHSFRGCSAIVPGRLFPALHCLLGRAHHLFRATPEAWSREGQVKSTRPAAGQSCPGDRRRHPCDGHPIVPIRLARPRVLRTTTYGSPRETLVAAADRTKEERQAYAACCRQCCARMRPNTVVGFRGREGTGTDASGFPFIFHVRGVSSAPPRPELPVAERPLSTSGHGRRHRDPNHVPRGVCRAGSVAAMLPLPLHSSQYLAGFPAVLNRSPLRRVLFSVLDPYMPASRPP